jgi:hypothetical protein
MIDDDCLLRAESLLVIILPALWNAVMAHEKSLLLRRVSSGLLTRCSLDKNVQILRAILECSVVPALSTFAECFAERTKACCIDNQLPGTRSTRCLVSLAYSRARWLIKKSAWNSHGPWFLTYRVSLPKPLESVSGVRRPATVTDQEFPGP